ncbi:MAG: hypothetical protein ACK5NY_03450 [Burkholderiaceae bacterium]
MTTEKQNQATEAETAQEQAIEFPSLSDVFAMAETQEDASVEADEAPAQEAEQAAEEPAKAEVETDELSTLKKRLEDTQKWGQDANQKLKALMKKMANGEKLSPDEIEKLAAEAGETNEDQVRGILPQLNKDLQIILPVMKRQGKSDDQLKAAIEAFDHMGFGDPSIRAELMTLPEAERAAYVLEKGTELADVYSVVKADGSALASLRKLVKQTADIEKAAFERGRLEAQKELEAKYKDVVLPTTKSKPKLTGSAPTSTKGEETTGPLTFKDIGL